MAVTGAKNSIWTLLLSHLAFLGASVSVFSCLVAVDTYMHAWLLKIGFGAPG